MPVSSPNFNGTQEKRKSSFVQHDNLSNALSSIGGLVGNLASDLGSLVTLKIDLLKAEVREGARDVAKDSVLLIASAVCAVFALLGITAALSIALGGILPLAAPYNYACGALLVAAIYAGAGTILFFMGKERVKTSRIKPKQTIDDFKRDKQWLTTHQ